MTSAPVEHLDEALKLEADAHVDLYEVTLAKTNDIIRFYNGPTKTWQGFPYEGLACQVQGEGRNTDGQYVRPTLTVINPDKIFGPYAAAGYLDLAVVVRKRLLQEHFFDDVNIFEQQTWISYPKTVTSQVIQVVLKSVTDQPNWMTPKREYSPPEYPFVVL